MLFAILMTICRANDPSACHEERVEFEGPAMGCIVSAQPVVVDWTDRHPEWTVKSWKCRPR
ncbi:hypothetical protein JOD31_003653 [Methylopila capsulata]|uniref:Uncharacterized protein n=1 Tax=Methylopila capsulata TaxID=61654 RepID=A0A9W6IY13_9HYPH|nr:hypothetical protein [Methylopila capsulata]MBM7853392.1 hypothetical protein [Methylopila capsulata]GLK57395.1 hypothetical protein GCM10008170_34150 [Methylopila capsulata]